MAGMSAAFAVRAFSQTMPMTFETVSLTRTSCAPPDAESWFTVTQSGGSANSMPVRL
jgi:hypothetical protein